MDKIKGFLERQKIPKHHIKTFSIYSIEMSEQGDKKYSKAAFKHVVNLIETKHYFFTEYCNPLENHSVGDPEGFWDEVHKLVEKSIQENKPIETTPVEESIDDYGDSIPLPEGITEEDLASGKVKITDLPEISSPEIELTPFQKDYNQYYNWRFEREEKRQFYGKRECNLNSVRLKNMYSKY